MKTQFSILLIFLINYSIFSQNDIVDLSKIKLCETKISDFKEPFNIIPVIELDDCPNGISTAKVPGYQSHIGYSSTSYKNVTFQIYIPDSTIYKIILNKEFKGYLTDGQFIDMSLLKANDIADKVSEYWFKYGCSQYIGLGFKLGYKLGYNNIQFHIKEDKSIIFENMINHEFYKTKNIDIITIQSSCYKLNRKKLH